MESLVNTTYLRACYQGKKVFITGHTGFKGSWLSLWLKMLGAEIKGYALAPEYKNCIYNLTHPYKDDESVIADIRNSKRLKEEILSFAPDYIFHMAAQPLVRRSYAIPSETFNVNVIGTSNLLEAVIQLQKKTTVIIITTDKVYDNKEKDLLYKETDALGGYDPYSASKACAELVVSSFRNSFFNTEHHSRHRKAIATVRAGNVIGGGDYSLDRIVPDMVRALENNAPVEVRNPNAVRPWQHVLEPLSGYLLLGGLLGNNLHFSGAYNFGPMPEDHLTVKELVEAAIKVWGRGEWTDVSNSNEVHEASLLKLDIQKALTTLNWKPKWNAPKAIEMTIDWYRNVAVADMKKFTLDQIKQYLQA